MNDNQRQATEVLKNGGIVIFPTDTAMGMGCRIDDKEAVKRFFSIRRRSETKPTPVLVSDIEMAKEWVDRIPEKTRTILEKYWPGGLTVVLNSKDTRVSNLVKGGGDSLGVRMPDYPGLLTIISHLNVPIIGSSANFAGEQTPYSQKELDPELVSLVDYVLPGGALGKQVSTVLDCRQEPYTVLRQGSVILDGTI